jgi:protein-L-isoaspartate(D-aspartate) O-methyltransferase
MTPEDVRLLRIAMVFVLVLGLSWLLVARPWQTPSPSATPLPTSMPTSTTAVPAETDAPSDSFADARHQMVEIQILDRGLSDPAVLAAMETVPRHLFVPSEWLQEAYADHPLPIGLGQTISQPYIVAWMTELLALKPGARVLEIGTGSGYQAAILGQMGMEVYTIEIVEPLAAQATARLSEMGYKNITVLRADGYYGWEEYSPFDGIVVTCAPDHIPPPLVDQLADGGRMVLPVGPPGGYQSLWLVEKHGDQVQTSNLGGVRFVPLTGEH